MLTFSTLQSVIIQFCNQYKSHTLFIALCTLGIEAASGEIRAKLLRLTASDSLQRQRDSYLSGATDRPTFVVGCNALRC